MPKCTNIIKLKELDEHTDVLKVVIDSTEESFWFYPYAKALEFVNQDVIVEYRQDIYEGNMVQVVNTFTVLTKVNTLDKKNNIRLFSDATDNFSNLSFNEISDGETREACIVYCIKQSFQSSSNAVWIELLIRDKSMHVMKARLFDYETTMLDVTGKYIMLDLRKTKFGFNTKHVLPVEGECPENPEVTIARSYIKEYFADDAVALEYISRTQLLEHLTELIDYEKGYALTRLAMELCLCEQFYNITDSIDIKCIARALLMSYGFATMPDSPLSASVNNIVVASRFNWNGKKEVLQLLDTSNPEPPCEVEIYNNIRQTITTLIEIKKGLKHQ